jgi:hypothetical protein
MVIDRDRSRWLKALQITAVSDVNGVIDCPGGLRVLHQGEERAAGPLELLGLW